MHCAMAGGVCVCLEVCVWVCVCVCVYVCVCLNVCVGVCVCGCFLCVWGWVGLCGRLYISLVVVVVVIVCVCVCVCAPCLSACVCLQLLLTLSVTVRNVKHWLYYSTVALAYCRGVGVGGGGWCGGVCVC